MYRADARIPHIVRKVKSMNTPINLLFFDTETTGTINLKKKEESLHYLWFGYAYALEYRKGIRSREKTTMFTTPIDFWKFLRTRLQKETPLYVFTHNLGFDLTIVDFWLFSNKQDMDIKFYVLEDPPTIIKCEWDKSNIVFIDTLNYWRTSLKMLGESIGISKHAMPKGRTIDEEWKTYCHTDVKIIAESILNLFDFLHSNNLGSFGYSAPSIAMSTYKYRFMNEKQIYIHDNNVALGLERLSYYGGMVENFFVGKPRKTIYKLDINSMYPYIMLQPSPRRLIGVYNAPNMTLTRRLLDEYKGCAKVTINSPKETYPKRIDKKLCFVNGNFETVLCGDDLDRAIHLRHIETIHQLACYEMEYLFTDYVNYFYAKRQEYKQANNKVYEQFCKLLLNSLYGKFGQKGFNWIQLTRDNLEKLYTHLGIEYPKEYELKPPQISIAFGTEKIILLGMQWPITFRSINGTVEFQQPIIEHSESFPAIAGFITAAARNYLLKLCSIAGTKHVYYTDTDSLFVDSIGLNNLKKKGYLDDYEIGKLKIEGKDNSAEFNSPKFYTFGNIQTIKGIRSDAIRIGPSEYLQNQFEGIKSVLSRHPEPFITIKYITKSNSGEFTKSIIARDGWTKPFTMIDNETMMLS